MTIPQVFALAIRHHLLKSIEGISQIIGFDEPLPAFDFPCLEWEPVVARVREQLTLLAATPHERMNASSQ